MQGTKLVGMHSAWTMNKIVEPCCQLYREGRMQFENPGHQCWADSLNWGRSGVTVKTLCGQACMPVILFQGVSPLAGFQAPASINFLDYISIQVTTNLKRKKDVNFFSNFEVCVDRQTRSRFVACAFYVVDPTDPPVPTGQSNNKARNLQN